MIEESGRVAEATGLSSTTAPQEGRRPSGFDPSREPIWPHIRISSYAPSHRQFRLDEALTPEEITKALGGIEPKARDGDKVTLQWTFWAEITYILPDGGHGSTSTGCKIWDYQGERWSAYGWPEAFTQVGLTPLLTKDYGSWVFEEDGNPTIPVLRAGLIAARDSDGSPEGGDGEAGSMRSTSDAVTPKAAGAQTELEQ